MNSPNDNPDDLPSYPWRGPLDVWRPLVLYGVPLVMLAILLVAMTCWPVVCQLFGTDPDETQRKG